jgi:hypothetical protein
VTKFTDGIRLGHAVRDAPVYFSGHLVLLQTRFSTGG